MKYIILITILFVSVSMTGQNDRHEKIKALKATFITNALNLTSEEAQKFWPIYNEYEEKMYVTRKTERKEIFGLIKEKGMENLSEKEANDLIEKGISIKEKELKYRIDLYQNLKKVVSSKKIIQLRKAEEEFKRNLLEEYKRRKDKNRK